MEEHVSPEVIAKLLGETKPEIPPPEVKHFQFVVILADDTFPQKAPAIYKRGNGYASRTSCECFKRHAFTLRRPAGRTISRR